MIKKILAKYLFSKHTVHKFIQFFLVLALFFNAIFSVGIIVKAQESTPSADIVTEPQTTITPTEITPTVISSTPTATPEATLIPTPTEEITPLPTINLDSVTPTIMPTLFLEPNPISFDSAQTRLPIKIRPISPNQLQARESFSVEVVNAKYNLIEPKLIKNGEIIKGIPIEQKSIGDSIILTVESPSVLIPGKYKLQVTDALNHTEEEDFTWGLLAINANKSVYLPNEKANLALTVLDEVGKPVCDAKLSLEIRNPNLEIQKLSTEDKTIIVNPECQIHDYANKPNYEVVYQVGGAGKYKMVLTAETPNGTYSVEDSFEVYNSVPFIAERINPIRIYPLNNYIVNFKITVAQDFKGEVIETVPYQYDVNKVNNSDDITYTSLRTSNLSDTLSVSVGSLQMPFSGGYSVTLAYAQIPDDKELQKEYQLLGAIGHDGLDFALPVGTPVLAVDDGVVIQAGEGDYGLTVAIKHTWGISYYGHLSQVSVLSGQEVKKGDEIGLSGNTGLSTGPHLHIALEPNNPNVNNGYVGHIDPAPYFGIVDQSVLVKQISWDLELKAGDEVSLAYQFSAPNIESQVYLSGPLKFVQEGNVVYQENNRWQQYTYQSQRGAVLEISKNRKNHLLKMKETDNAVVNVLGYELPEFEIDLTDKKFEGIWKKNEKEIRGLIRNQLRHETNPAGLDNLEVNIDIDFVNRKLLIFPLMANFRAGLYHLEVNIPTSDGGVTIDQDFTWGVLAINTDKSIYKLGDNSLISIGVLNDKGQIICDAEVTLIIKDPAGREVVKSTKAGDISVSDKCKVKDIYQEPDYFTTYVPDLPGTYTMTLSATHQNGTYTVSDTFQAEASPLFSLKRTGPTRVWPVKFQPMTLEITASENFEGEIIERMPEKFQVEVGPDAERRLIAGTNEIVWRRSIAKGETIKLSYTFKAPEKSPDFYLLGPISIGNWQEARAWQLAIDPTYMYLFWDGGAPTGWSTVPTYNGMFPRGALAAVGLGTTGGATTHTTVVDGSVTQATGDTDTQVGPGSAGTAANAFAHTHTALSVTPASANNLPAYRSLILIKNDSGIPATILSGGIALFDADPNADWAKQTDQNSQMIQVNNSVTTGGSDSHQHNLVWSTLGANTSQRTARGGTAGLAANSGHTHSKPADSQTAAVAGNSLPPYVQVIVAKAGSEVSVPVGMIAMFDANPGTNWTVSSALNNQFVQGAASYNGTSAGSETHSHASVTSGNSGGASGGNKGEAGGSGTAAVDQNHKLTASFVANESNVPKFFTVVYAKRNPVTVSGKILQESASSVYEGTTKWDGCSDVTSNISWALDSVDQTNIKCNTTDGSFSFQPTFTSANQLITIWLDTAGGDKGVLYTKNNDTSSDISNLTVYKNRVWIQSESSQSITNANINTFDKSTNDTDIPIASDGTNVVVDSGVELHVNTGDTYAPGGNVTTDKIHIKGTYTGSTETLQLNGSGSGSCDSTVASIRPLCIDSGDFTAPPATTTFAGTTASNVETTTYKSLNISPASGTPTFTPVGALIVNNNLTVAAGALAMGANNLTIGSATVNSGSVGVGGTVSQTASGLTTIKSSVGGANCIGANSADCSGTPGTINFYDLTIGDSSTAFTTTINGTNPVVDVDRHLNITANAILAANGTLKVAGNWTKTGNFTKNSSIVNLDAVGTGQTIVGSTDFYDLIATGNSARIITFTASSTQTISHTLTLSGAVSNILTLQSSSSPTKWNINATGATVTADYLSVTNSNSTTCITATNSSGSSNTNWDFTGAGCVAGGPTTDQQMRHGTWFNTSGVKQPFTF